MNKRGAITDTIIFIAVSFIIVVMFALFVYGFGRINSIITTLPNTGTTAANFSYVAGQTFGQLTAGINNLRYVAILMIFGYIIAIFISSWLEKINPALGFFIYVLVTIIAFILAVYVSNAYEKIVQDPTLGPTLQSFTASTFVLLYLPQIILVIGFFGIIFLMSGIPRDFGLGGGI